MHASFLFCYSFVGDGDDFFVLESQAIPMDADGVDREDGVSLCSRFRAAAPIRSLIRRAY